MTEPLQIGDIVQISPEHDTIFGGCLMIVTDPKSWGAMGYFLIPGALGSAYYRVKFEHMVKVGHAEWMTDPSIEYPEIEQIIS